MTKTPEQLEAEVVATKASVLRAVDALESLLQISKVSRERMAQMFLSEAAARRQKMKADDAAEAAELDLLEAVATRLTAD
jgi:hypothetical protein